MSADVSAADDVVERTSVLSMAGSARTVWARRECILTLAHNPSGARARAGRGGPSVGSPRQLAWPTRGPQWVSDRLALQGLHRRPGGRCGSVLRRVGLNHRRARLAVLALVRTPPGPPCRGQAAGRPVFVGQFLHRQVEGGTARIWQLTSLRLRLVVWLGADRAGRESPCGNADETAFLTQVVLY